jgi:hypothetical protein
LIRFAPDPSAWVSTCIEGGTHGWMSPELLQPKSFCLEGVKPTKESDCYALGMVVYEVLGGRESLEEFRGYDAIARILSGERPERPQEEEAGKVFTDDVWGVVECCWKHQPGERMTAEAALLCLEGTPLPSDQGLSAVVDPEPDFDDQSNDTSTDL